VKKLKKLNQIKKQIPLSQSVGVGVPQKFSKLSHQIEIVNDLEETYRPRYKSDYFAQNGKLRKPRYVADRLGNHYVTLKVSPGVRGTIRVDWLTIPTKTGDRYFMPYRFQASNELPEIPDCNPIFKDIDADSNGNMRLYLVLIKSKQDALKSLQPLQPFHPFQDALGFVDETTPEKMLKLTPKQLIQQYQLDKSQLAFTFCTLSADGRSYIPKWDTTVFSTVLTETASDTPPSKAVTCPKCSVTFEVTVCDGCGIDQEVTISKRKKLPVTSNKSTAVKKQRSLSEVLYVMQ